MIIADKIMAGLRGFKRVRIKRVDVVSQQVKDVLEKADQKLILMVRG